MSTKNENGIEKHDDLNFKHELHNFIVRTENPRTENIFPICYEIKQGALTEQKTIKPKKPNPTFLLSN